MCGGNLKELAATLDPTKDNRFRVLIDQAMSMSIVPTATE